MTRATRWRPRPLVMRVGITLGVVTLCYALASWPRVVTALGIALPVLAWLVPGWSVRRAGDVRPVGRSPGEVPADRGG